MWIEFNCNPKLRRIDDCTVRALSVAIHQPWRRCHEILADVSRGMGLMMDDKAVYNSVIKSLGFTRSVIPEDCPDCYTLKDFCREYPIGTYIVATNNHVVAVVDGDYFDTFDSGDETPIYFWEVTHV